MTTQPQLEKLATISFRVPEVFKREVDSMLGKMGVKTRTFCMSAIAEKLGIPVPGEEERKKRRTA